MLKAAGEEHLVDREVKVVASTTFLQAITRLICCRSARVAPHREDRENEPRRNIEAKRERKRQGVWASPSGNAEGTSSVTFDPYNGAKLDYSDRQLGDSGAETVAEALKNRPDLKVLDLSK